jgi:anti-sigma factor RsiW
MNCEESQSQLHPYSDGELDLMKSLELEHHLSECAMCSQAHDDLTALRKALRSDSLRFRPSADFEARVKSALRREANGGRPWFSWTWLIPLFSAALLLIVFSGYLLTRSSSDDLVAREIVSSHVRSLMTPNHTIDVPSEDPHTVKPWFDGKLDFSPPVRDFTAQGFALIGGRLDYIANRPVAALIYERRKHQINVFIWPAVGGDIKPTAQVQQGYNVIHWTKSGMTFWAISDLNLAELQQLQGELEKQ